MSKFSKRLRKIAKRPRNAFILGDDLEVIEDILEVFSSAFMLGDFSKGLRKKNLIYIERISDIYDIPNIDMVFVDKNCIERILELQPMYKRSRPIFFVWSDTNISRDIIKLLKGDSYNLTDIEKHYHIWKPA